MSGGHLTRVGRMCLAGTAYNGISATRIWERERRTSIRSTSTSTHDSPLYESTSRLALAEPKAIGLRSPLLAHLVSRPPRAPSLAAFEAYTVRTSAYKRASGRGAAGISLSVIAGVDRFFTDGHDFASRDAESSFGTRDHCHLLRRLRRRPRSSGGGVPARGRGPVAKRKGLRGD